MPHTFTIKGTSTGTAARFDGYCNALMYRSFSRQDCDKGIMGDGSQYTIDRADAIKGLNNAVIDFDNSNYPATKRADEIKSFLMRIKDGNIQDDSFVIRFT